MSPAPEPDRAEQIEAAHYALRIMSPEEEKSFEAKTSEQPNLLKHVSAWLGLLAPLNTLLAPVAPPPEQLGQLEQALFPNAKSQLVDWNSIQPWHTICIGLLVLSAFLSLRLFSPTELPIGQGVSRDYFISELTSTDDKFRYLALYRPKTGELRLTRTAGSVADGRALQLWAISPDGLPTSLGVLSDEISSTLVINEDIGPELPDLVFAISTEPAGGSRDDAPTGQVLAAGRFSKL